MKRTLCVLFCCLGVADNAQDKVTVHKRTGLNAETTFDYTAYYNSFSSEKIEPWLDLNSERFLNPVFRMFQSELEIVYDEMDEEYLGGIEAHFQETMFAPHPYSKPLIGNPVYPRWPNCMPREDLGRIIWHRRHG